MKHNPLSYYDTNHPLLDVGTDTFTFNMGKIVPVRVVEATASEHANIYGPKYKVQYTGMDRICLDFGEDFWLEPNDLFVCHQNNIDAALRWQMERA